MSKFSCQNIIVLQNYWLVSRNLIVYINLHKSGPNYTNFYTILDQIEIKRKLKGQWEENKNQMSN